MPWIKEHIRRYKWSKKYGFRVREHWRNPPYYQEEPEYIYIEKPINLDSFFAHMFSPLKHIGPEINNALSSINVLPIFYIIAIMLAVIIPICLLANNGN